jgi:hypothetical protein
MESSLRIRSSALVGSLLIGAPFKDALQYELNLIASSSS